MSEINWRNKLHSKLQIYFSLNDISFNSSNKSFNENSFSFINEEVLENYPTDFEKKCAYGI